MPTGEMLSVVGLGIGTVFVGLIAIILLCKIFRFLAKWMVFATSIVPLAE